MPCMAGQTHQLVFALLLGSMAAGCGSTAPKLAPVPRSVTPINASFGRTWDAVVEVVAERSRTIQTVDEASGLIIVGDVFLGDSTASWADCGSNMVGAVAPTHLSYNVVVRGDSTSATVKVNAFFISRLDRPVTDCVSRGVWEAGIEKLIKARAESAR